MLLLSTTTGLLGRVGAALARAAMIAIGFSILHREMGVKAPENLMRSIIVAIVVASALEPMELLLKADLYLKASIEALAFTAVLLMAFKLVKPLDSDEVELVKSIMPWRTRTYKPTA
jgi:hypothetical protein